MSSTPLPRKRSAPTLAQIEHYWWEDVDGSPRFQLELFGAMHGLRVASEGHHGDAHVCFACCMSPGPGEPIDRWLHRGHIVAETYGGTVDLWNMVPLCARCNLAMPRLESREASIEWMEDRELWSSYLARIDAATPEHVDPLQVIVDAQRGRDWTPEAFAAHYAR